MDASGSGRTTRRRELLATLGSAGAVAVAGCGSTTDAEVGAAADREVPAPSVTKGDRWELTTPNSEPRLLRKGSAGPVNYTAVGHVRRYEDAKLRDRVAESTFGEIDRPFAVAFAARVDVFPSTLSAATGFMSEELDAAVRENLTDAMDEFGVENVREAGTRSVSDAPVEEFAVVRGEYPIPEVTVEDVEIPLGNVDEFTFGGGRLPIEGIAGRWKSDGSILAGGGVYPAENYVDSETVELSDGISMEVTVDLGLRPDRIESRVLEFVRGVSA
ncbi:hypothetical protein [Halomicrobium salinisoli]|uniref:hypothetical protein n=1 Tax=Halomicrobium salinisoli TaxID=2878391 RepID=UPI001CF008BF|nr:hypothetical protein [Halomicrobium salinisoli]